MILSTYGFYNVKKIDENLVKDYFLFMKPNIFEECAKSIINDMFFKSNKVANSMFFEKVGILKEEYSNSFYDEFNRLLKASFNNKKIFKEIIKDTMIDLDYIEYGEKVVKLKEPDVNERSEDIKIEKLDENNEEGEV